MLIREIAAPPKPFTATVRAGRQGAKNTLRTVLYADSLTQARTLAMHLFGKQNVLVVRESQCRFSRHQGQ